MMKVLSGEMLEVPTAPVKSIMECSPEIQPMVHPAFIGMNSSFYESRNAGYNACADEAIRYLVEEEHYSPDDPLVTGLRDHLRQQQQLYNLQQIFQHFSRQSDADVLDDSGVSFKSQQDDLNIYTETNSKVQSETDLDMAAISSLTEEILSLLEEEDSLSDFEDSDDSYIMEQ